MVVNSHGEMLFRLVLSDYVLIHELFDLDRFFYLDVIHIKRGRVTSLFFLYDVICLLCTHITDKTVYPRNQKINLAT